MRITGVQLRTAGLTITLMLTVFAGLAASEQDSRSKSFTVTKGGTLDISVGGGDIRVGTWEKNEVFVRADGLSLSDLERLEMTQSGNNVTVRLRPRWSTFRNVRFEVKLPTEFNTELKTSGGDIEFEGALKGKVKGSTAGGDIRLRDVVGTVDMTTAGGDIRAETVGGDVYLKTSGGNIELGDVAGKAEVATSGGDIRVTRVGKSLRAKTAGGDIKVGDVGGEAEISTSGGDIRVGKVSGKVSLSTGGGDIQLKSASGSVKANTTGGDLELLDVSGTVEGKTAGGDVVAEMRPSGQGESSLSSSGGSIKLYVAENARVTIEATIGLRYGWSWGKQGYYGWAWGRKSHEIRSDFKADKYETNEDDKEIHAVYTLNGGGEVITLETVNSNIEIRKLRR